MTRRVQLVRRLYVPAFLVLLLTTAPKFVLAVLQLGVLGALILISAWALWRTAPGFSGLVPGLRRVVGRADLLLKLTTMLMAVYAVALLAMPVFPAARQILLDRFLLATSYPQWAVWQASPALYSAENRMARIASDVKPDTATVEEALRQTPEWIIHHPARATFSSRQETDRPAREWHAYRSVLGDSEATALFEVEFHDDGSDRVTRHESFALDR